MLAIRIDRLLSYIYWVYAPGILSNTCFHTSFMTIPEVFSTSLLCLAVWVVWKVIKKLIFVPDLDNIPGPPSDSYLKGHLHRVFGPNAADFHKEVFEKYGRIANIKFPFGESKILLSDPKALHHIIIKDQHAYEVAHWFTTSNRVLFGPGLLGSVAQTHRRQRKMLNPVFSIAHMRGVVPIFYGVTYRLRDAIASKVTVKDGPQEIDIFPWLSRISLEFIGKSGFGHSFDPLTEHAVSNSYAASVKQIGPSLSKLLFLRVYMLPKLSRIGTRRLQRFIVERLPGKVFKDITKCVDTIHRTSLEIIESKKRALSEGNGVIEDEIARGKDLISVLLRSNIQAEKEDRLSDEELVGQVSTFTFGATETTSSALCRIFWVLSERQDAQDKLRIEICEARKKHDDCTYDVLNGLPYLDAVCRETLRLYPPFAGLLRTARNDIVLPLGTPIMGRDGKEISQIPVPNGTDIIISALACNTDPGIWGSDSYEWKPERWLEPLPDTVTNARIPGVYSNLMTFNGGSRACIGFKFAQLEMKVVLLLLIESFKVSRSSSKDIYWRSQGIASPWVRDDSDHPKLPLIFERVG